MISSLHKRYAYSFKGPLQEVFKKMIEIGELVEGYIYTVLGEWESLKKRSIC